MEAVRRRNPATHPTQRWSPRKSLKIRRLGRNPYPTRATTCLEQLAATGSGPFVATPRPSTSLHAIPSSGPSSALPSDTADGEPQVGTCVQVPHQTFLDVGPSSAAGDSFWRLLTCTLVPPPSRTRLATLLACLESVYRAEYQQLAGEAITAIAAANNAHVRPDGTIAEAEAAESTAMLLTEAEAEEDEDEEDGEGSAEAGERTAADKLAAAAVTAATAAAAAVASFGGGEGADGAEGAVYGSTGGGGGGGRPGGGGGGGVRAADLDAEALRRLLRLARRAGYQPLTVRDVRLADSLNADYLSQLFIKGSTRRLDGALVQSHVDPRLPAEARPVLLLHRGYGREVAAGRLLLQKLDYLQTLVAGQAGGWAGGAVAALVALLFGTFEDGEGEGQGQGSGGGASATQPAQAAAVSAVTNAHVSSRAAGTTTASTAADVAASSSETGLPAGAPIAPRIGSCSGDGDGTLPSSRGGDAPIQRSSGVGCGCSSVGGGSSSQPFADPAAAAAAVAAAAAAAVEQGGGGQAAGGAAVGTGTGVQRTPAAAGRRANAGGAAGVPRKASATATATATAAAAAAVEPEGPWASALSRLFRALSEWGLAPRSDVLPLAAFNAHFPVPERPGRPPLRLCKVSLADALGGERWLQGGLGGLVDGLLREVQLQEPTFREVLLVYRPAHTRMAPLREEQGAGRGGGRGGGSPPAPPAAHRAAGVTGASSSPSTFAASQQPQPEPEHQLDDGGGGDPWVQTDPWFRSSLPRWAMRPFQPKQQHNQQQQQLAETQQHFQHQSGEQLGREDLHSGARGSGSAQGTSGNGSSIPSLNPRRREAAAAAGERRGRAAGAGGGGLAGSTGSKGGRASGGRGSRGAGGGGAARGGVGLRSGWLRRLLLLQWLRGAAWWWGSGRRQRGAAVRRPPVQIRIYRDIPLPTWKVVLPEKLLQFRPLDLLRLDLFAVAGLAGLAAQARYDNLVLDVLTFGSAAVLGVRIVLGYQRMADRFRSVVNELLVEKALAGQEGAVEALAAAAAQQQLRQAALAYVLLGLRGTAGADRQQQGQGQGQGGQEWQGQGQREEWQKEELEEQGQEQEQPVPAMATTAMLQDLAERALAHYSGVRVRFNACQALHELQRLGLVVRLPQHTHTGRRQQGQEEQQGQQEELELHGRQGQRGHSAGECGVQGAGQSPAATLRVLEETEENTAAAVAEATLAAAADAAAAYLDGKDAADDVTAVGGDMGCCCCCTGSSSYEDEEEVDEQEAEGGGVVSAAAMLTSSSGTVSAVAAAAAAVHAPASRTSLASTAVLTTSSTGAAAASSSMPDEGHSHSHSRSHGVRTGRRTRPSLHTHTHTHTHHDDGDAGTVESSGFTAPAAAAAVAAAAGGPTHAARCACRCSCCGDEDPAVGCDGAEGCGCAAVWWVAVPLRHAVEVVEDHWAGLLWRRVGAILRRRDGL